MTIMIVGVGALGSRIAELLKGEDLIFVDYDIVQEDNLDRQPLYTKEDLGSSKVDAAVSHLGGRAIRAPFTKDTPVSNVDCIVEGTDNMLARSVINDVAKKKNIPAVFATAAKKSGLVTDTCWQCITRGKISTDDCSTGIDAETAETVAVLAEDMVRHILAGHPHNTLMSIKESISHNIQVPKNPKCKACQNIFFDDPFTVQFCPGTKTLQARPSEPIKIDLDALENVTESFVSAKRVKLDEGSALVHAHGLIEFENVPEDRAHEFGAQLLKHKT